MKLARRSPRALPGQRCSPATASLDDHRRHPRLAPRGAGRALRGHPRARRPTATSSWRPRARRARPRSPPRSRPRRARPGCRCRTRARRWPLFSAAVLGDPAPLARARRRHRHQRQDHDDLPDRRRPARRRPQGRPARHRAVPHRRPPGRGGAHHAGGVRPAGALPRDGGRRLLARACSRSPRTRSRSSASHGCEFQVAVFTNLTRDHLDFHGDMDAYFAGQAEAVRRRCCGRTAARS